MVAHSSSLPSHLDHGYKRHDPLHVFLQFGQGSQVACYHFVVWKNAIVALKNAKKDNTVRADKQLPGR